MIQAIKYNLDKNKLEEFTITDRFYKKFIPPVFFDRNEFHLYHEKFTDKVYSVIIESRNKIIGYCYLGLRNNSITAPYSSPFSLIYPRVGYRIKDICSIIRALKELGKTLKHDKLSFTLPPVIYSVELINTLMAAFYSEGFRVSQVDINNYFNLGDFVDLETYLKEGQHKVRKNYKKAIKNGLSFLEIPGESFKLAYDVIRTNREQMGYPLKITEQHMQDLINMDCLNTRCFVIQKQDEYAAAAIVFDVTDDVSQVIYWGDNIGYRNERPMDLLTTEVFNLYAKIGKRHLDIGPSSENGIINTGLADFKKSIGCSSCIKMTFEYDL